MSSKKQKKDWQVSLFFLIFLFFESILGFIFMVIFDNLPLLIQILIFKFLLSLIVILQIDQYNLLILLNSIGNHLTQIAVLLIGHGIKLTKPTYDLPNILRTNPQHDHIVTEHGQLAEEQVFFDNGVLLEGLGLRVEV